MIEGYWKASSLRNWLWFSHIQFPLRVGVNCGNLGSVCYELAGKGHTMLLAGQHLTGAQLPFSAPSQARALLEGERLHWKWSLSKGFIQLVHLLSCRRVLFFFDHCTIQDEDRHFRLDRKNVPKPVTVEKATDLRSPVAVLAENHDQDVPETVESISAPVAHLSSEPIEAHWTDSISEEPIRRVLRHIERYGSVNEEEVTEFLGSPRQARAFSTKLEECRNLIPFKIEIDTRSGLKSYRKA